MTTWDALLTSRPPEGQPIDDIVSSMLDYLQGMAGVDAWTTSGNLDGSISAHFGLMVPSHLTMTEAFGQAVKVFHEAALASGWIPEGGEGVLEDPVPLIGMEFHMVGDMAIPDVAVSA